jgi:hypothetical protein
MNHPTPGAPPGLWARGVGSSFRQSRGRFRQIGCSVAAPRTVTAQQQALRISAAPLTAIKRNPGQPMLPAGTAARQLPVQPTS